MQRKRLSYRRLSYCLAALLALGGLGGADARAQDALKIPRTSAPPELDDYVAGLPTDHGVEISEFKQQSPGDGNPVSLETRAYLSYDDDHLYVVFVCKDDPELVRARIARRENIFGDEGVQILLDTFDDDQRAFVFAANPYGVQLDSKLTEGQGYDYNFDTQWKSDGVVTRDGYVTMFSIPFKSLRFHPGEKQNWGVAIGRIIPRFSEFSYWPYITQRKQGFVQQFAPVEIDSSISPGRNISLTPTLTYRDQELLGLDRFGVPGIRRKTDTEVGLDAKFVIRDALAVDLTVNPDFGEIESDAPQVIVNQRFEVRFPEKRPFFLENAGFFGTPQSLFFSRRIVDPEYGARATGRFGRWAVGALAINDEAAGLPYGTDDNGHIGVLRVQRDFAKQSNVGVFLSGRRVGDVENRVYSLDSRVRLNDNWALTGQVVGSRFDNGAGAEGDDRLLYVAASRASRDWNYSGEYLDIGEDFRSDLGFIPRTDIRQTTHSLSYLHQFDKRPWLVSAGPVFAASRTWDQEGDLQDWSAEAGYRVNGRRLTAFEARWIESYELYQGFDFRKRNIQLSAASDWFKWLSASVSYDHGDGVNFFPALGVAPFRGDSRQLVASADFKITPQFQVNQQFIWTDLRTQDAINGNDAGSRAYRSTQSRTKVRYQFSKFLDARVIFDYAALDPNTTLFAAPRTKRLTTDFLVSYVLSPGTALYVGYTEQEQNLRLVGSPPVIQPTNGLDLKTGKQIFMKLTYLFNL